MTVKTTTTPHTATLPSDDTHQTHQPERGPLVFLGFDLDLRGEDLQEAIDAWSAYLSRLEHPTPLGSLKELMVQARLRRGAAHSMLREWEAAIADFQQVIEAECDPDLTRAACGLLGSVYCEQGRDEAAIACWTRLLDEYEQATAKRAEKLPLGVPLLYLYRGLLLARLERFAEAVADCTRAATCFPAHAEIYAVRGLAKAYLGEMEAGLADCTHAIALAPHEASWHQRRGVVQLLRRDYRLALEDFRQALALDPEHVQAQQGYLEASMKVLMDLLREAERGAEPAAAHPAKEP